MGRRTLYDPKLDKIVKKLARKGMLNKEIYEMLGISHVTGIDWKRKYPNFAKAIKEGHAEAKNLLVEKSLYELANGYEYKTEKIVVVANAGQFSGSSIARVKVTEKLPPSILAIKYYLNNRNSKDWQERQTIEHTGKLEYKVIPDDIEEKEE